MTSNANKSIGGTAFPLEDGVKVLNIMDPTPQITRVYFSDSPDFKESYVPEVTAYGKEKDRRKVYCHVVVRSLFAVYNRTRAVAGDPIELHVDFYAIGESTAKRLAHAQPEDLSDIPLSSEVCDQKTVVLKIDQQTFGGMEIKATVDGAAVWGHAAAPLHVTEIGMQGAGQTLYDLCFEFILSPEEETELDKAPTCHQRIFAWAWVVCDETKEVETNPRLKLYGGIGKDIETREGRHELLRGASRSLLKRLTSRIARAMKQPAYEGEWLTNLASGVEEVASDQFWHDEPAANVLHLNKKLPFSSFRIGSMLGSVGIGSSAVDEYKWYRTPRIVDEWYPQGVRLTRQSPTTPREGTKPYRPHGILFRLYKNGDEYSGVPLEQGFSTRGALPEGAPDVADDNTGEVYCTYEKPYMYKPGSAAAWVCSLEREVVIGSGRPEEQRRGKVYTGAELASLKGYLDVDLHETTGPDCRPLEQYDEGFPKSVRLAERDDEGDLQYPQKLRAIQYLLDSVNFTPLVFDKCRLSLDSFKTVNVPSGCGLHGKEFPAITSTTTGVRLAAVGKGLPARTVEEAFLPISHGLVNVSLGGHGTTRLEAHAYVHRPLVITYRLEDDLTPTERSLFDGKMSIERPHLKISVGKEQGIYPLHLPDECTVAGTHMILLYLAIPEGATVGVEFEPAGHIDRVVGFPMCYEGMAPASVSTFGARDLCAGSNGGILAGLFQGNPVISVDTVSPRDLRSAAIDAAKQAIDAKQKKMSQEFAKLLMSFFPLSDAISLGMDIIENAAQIAVWDFDKGKKRYALGVKGLDALLGRVLGKKYADYTQSLTETHRSMFGASADPTDIYWGQSDLDSLNEKRNSMNTWMARVKVGGTVAKKSAGLLTLAKLSWELGKLCDALQSELAVLREGMPFGKAEKDQLILASLCQTVRTIERVDGALTTKVRHVEVPATIALRQRSNQYGLLVAEIGEAPYRLEWPNPAEAWRGSRDHAIMEWMTPFFKRLGALKGLVKSTQSAAGKRNLLEAELRGSGADIPGTSRADLWLALTDSDFVNAMMGLEVNPALYEMASTVTRTTILEAFAKKGCIEELPASEADSVIDAFVYMQLWQYINSTVTSCPECGRVMNADWGWCPYHGMGPVGEQREYNSVEEFAKDANRRFREAGGFAQYLDKVKPGASSLGPGSQVPGTIGLSVRDTQERRFMVHRTEFISTVGN